MTHEEEEDEDNEDDEDEDEEEDEEGRLLQGRVDIVLRSGRRSPSQRGGEEGSGFRAAMFSG